MWKGSLTKVFVIGIIACTAAFAAPAATEPDSAARVDQSQPNPQPPYPDSAQLSGEQGTVLVGVLIRPNGRVGKFRVVKSSGFEDLDTAAVQGAMNWHYVPAVRNGEVVSDWATVKIDFQLPKPPAPPAN